MVKRNKSKKKKLSVLYLVAVVLAVIVVGAAFAISYSNVNMKKTFNPEAENFLHWHAALVISINGNRVEVPAGIGLGTNYSSDLHYNHRYGLTSMHTHDRTGIMHWEFDGFYTEEDLYLGNFFRVWGKNFNSTCIMEYCNGPNGTVIMKVNGQPNQEFDKYPIKDGDFIEILYGFEL